MDRKKRYANAGIVTGLALGIGYFILNLIAKSKKKQESLDVGLQKDRYENAGKTVKNRKYSIYGSKVKYAIDKGLSFLGLLVLAPVYAILSLAIVIDDPGPVFFKQKRVGQKKEFFNLHKFRSMKMSTPHDVPTHMLENPEQYITRVGKFLRKYSLDELPQIWDIFVGNMSVIGPRPALWNQEDLVAERDKYGANDVRPGLTGWAQINGRDELEIPVKAKYDGEYVQKMSLWFDIKCFFGTFLMVAKHKGVVEGKAEGADSATASVSKAGFGEPVEVDFSNHKNILITGAGSYIGESFRAYAEGNYGQNFTIDTIDMVDGSWREKDFSPYDAVFHVAGIAHADVGKVDEATKQKYYAVNTDLAIETAKKAKADGVGQFVFMSSIIVYGDSARYGEERNITEYTKPDPANFYGDSKWQADKGVRELADEQFAVLVLRPPMIYGEGSKGNYPTLAKLAKKLPVFPDINNERSMLHIDNLCEFLCLVMLVGKGGVFFPQNKEYTKTSDMVKEISNVCGKKLLKLPLLNPFVWLGAKVPGKIGGLANKAFGNMTYDQGLSNYPGLEYQVVGLRESIVRTEKKNMNGRKPRALMLASVASMIDQFNMDNIKILLELGYEVEVVADFVDGGTITAERVEDLKKRLYALGVAIFHVPIPRKVTNITGILKAYKQVKRLCADRNYKVIHCHSPIGGVIARVAAKGARHNGTKVIYTAHGFHFYDGAPKRNWLLFYPIEKICSKWTDILITINQEDYFRAKKNFCAKRVAYVPGVGVDTEKFSLGGIDLEKKRDELGVAVDDIMLLSIGELSDRKNHEVVIQALKEVSNPKIKYFIVGQGPLEQKLVNLVETLGLTKQVILLGYRTDVSELCQAADLFVFPSHQEGLPVALMEAIACKTPVICSNIRGNKDIVKGNRYLFDENDVEDLVKCIKSVGSSRTEIKNIMGASIRSNYHNLKKFDLESVSRNMTSLYAWGGVKRLLMQQRFRKEIGISLDGAVLLSVGELNENKNHEVIIKALAKMKMQNVYYVICGIGDNKDYLSILSKKLGVDKKVLLLGHRIDIGDIYSYSDVFVFPSWREGLSLALMEAMASGLPIVCSDIRGNRDLIVNGKNGFLIAGNEETAYAHAIKEILCHKKLQNDMSMCNRTMIQRFDRKIVDLSMKKIYQSK